MTREPLWPFAVLPAVILNLGAIVLFALHYTDGPAAGTAMARLFFQLYVFIACVEWAFFTALFFRLRRLRISWCSLLATDERPWWFRMLPALLMLVLFNAIFAVYMWLASFTAGGWPSYSEWSPAQRIFMVSVVPVTAALSEEFIWRGYLLTRMLQRMRPWRAILLSAISFAAIHGILPDRFVVTLLLGIVAGYYYYRERKLVPLIAAHLILDVWSFGFTAYGA